MKIKLMRIKSSVTDINMYMNMIIYVCFIKLSSQNAEISGILQEIFIHILS